MIFQIFTMMHETRIGTKTPHLVILGFTQCPKSTNIILSAFDNLY
jgi:hypothetical protein